MSIKRNQFDCWRHAALAGALSLGFGAATVAAEPAARLLPPQPVAVMVSRASAEEIVPLDPPAPVVKVRERPKDFKFPSPYSKRPALFDFTDDADKLLGPKKESQPSEKPAAALERDTTLIAKGGGAPVPPAPVNAAIVPAPLLTPEAPAWRWYGYGAPVPGSNPYAPSGVYAPVNPSYYHQTGSTPGSIPQPLMPMQRVLPYPTSTEPPALMSRPLPSDLEQPAPSDVAPAMLEVPIPFWKPTTGEPQAARPIAPTIRAQAPEPVVSEATIDRLRQTCTGYASRVEVVVRDEGHLLLRLTLATGATADYLAARLNQMPELRGYQIEMEFVR